MRILCRKISGEQHELAIVRPDGRRESLVCETRSVLMHDFIHHAVESAARLESGFWGLLARGRTLAEMNDRAGLPSAEEAAEMAIVERFVGALSGAAKQARSCSRWRRRSLGTEYSYPLGPGRSAPPGPKVDSVGRNWNHRGCRWEGGLAGARDPYVKRRR
jgi:hypothetical protein